MIQNTESGRHLQQSFRRDIQDGVPAQQNGLRQNPVIQSSTETALDNNVAFVRRNSFSRTRSEQDDDLFETEDDFMYTETAIRDSTQLGERWVEDDYGVEVGDMDGDTVMLG